MVVFTCGHCGESVQKPKVEKHYLTKCRNRNPNLSCMDCFKDFLGKDYESHIKCITEEQRYSGKGFVAKEKKGEKKQNAWVEMLQSVLDEQKTAPKNVLRIIETISKHNNTPRKKPKFFNFVKNVCGSKTSPKDIDQAWDLISGKLSALSSVNNAQNKNEKTSGDETNKDSANTDNNQDEDSENDSKENDLKSEKVASDSEIKNNKNDQELESVDEKKLSKKQRKEEKKRKKYEAELQSAAEPVVEEEEEEQPSKKDKKKKNKSDALTNVNETDEDSKTKKKRKRQDTANSAVEVIDVEVEHENEVPVAKDKSQKKKLKVRVEEDADENISMCLHDLNVANGEESEEPVAKQDKFDWHAVIISVLEKKGNELPFKRLQKKVLSEYTEATGWEVDDRIADKFIKKLKSAPKVKVDKNRVLLEE